MKEVLEFYYNVLRGTPRKTVRKLFSNVWTLNQQYALSLMFQLRDCRGGKGERQAFYWCLEWLLDNEYYDTVIDNLENIVHFGSWRDLRFLLTRPDIEEEVYNFWASQLYKDLESNKVTLACKWFPKENSSFDKKYGSAKKMAKTMNISLKQLRKNVLVPLNKKIKESKKLNVFPYHFLRHENQEELFQKIIEKTESLENCLVVVDSPHDAGISLAILLALKVKEPFQNLVLSREFREVNDTDDLLLQSMRICKSLWGTFPDINTQIDLMLKKALDHKVHPLDMPKTLICITKSSEINLNEMRHEFYKDAKHCFVEY